MKLVTGEEALDAAEKIVEDLDRSADSGENFSISPEQARKLAIIIRYLLQPAHEDRLG